MGGVTHRDPGLALAALLDDEAWVELIADTQHVDPTLWPLIWRLKPAERVLLVSDAIALAGSGRTRGWLGELEVVVDGERVTLVEGGNLAGSVTALDLELANVVRCGHPAARTPCGPPAPTRRSCSGWPTAAAWARAAAPTSSSWTPRCGVRRVMRQGAWIADHTA